jgi:hypothetical protein
MTDSSDYTALRTRLLETGSLLPVSIVAEVRGDGAAQFLHCTTNAGSAELSEADGDVWLELWRPKADSPTKHASFRTHLEAAIAVAEWLGTGWDGHAPPLSTSAPWFQRTVEAWLKSSKEVLVVIKIVYGAGSRSFEFFTDIESFRKRIAALRAKDCVVVLRDEHLPLRGCVDDDFIAKVLAQVPDGADWLIACTEPITMGKARWFHNYPGNNRAELEEELRDDVCYGKQVAVGLEPPYERTSDGVITAYVPNPDGSVTPGAY